MSLLTRINLQVSGYTICADNILKAIGELVGFEVSGWCLFGAHSLNDAGHIAATYFLKYST